VYTLLLVLWLKDLASGELSERLNDPKVCGVGATEIPSRSFSLLLRPEPNEACGVRTICTLLLGALVSMALGFVEIQTREKNRG
jgi:hypothetical protein